jgi:predicted Fe-Mo cluster-binding NifX family protein
VNLDEGKIINRTVTENPARFEKGAGNMTADFLVNQDIDILISGEMRPIAFYLLRKAGIMVYKAASVSAAKNLNRFTKGKLKEITTISSGYPK